MSSMRSTLSADKAGSLSQKREQRNSSIELLRILAMCGVVLLHYNNASMGGGLKYAVGTNRVVLMLLESLFICAVDLYVLISGYFLCTTTSRKFFRPLELMLQVCLFGALKYALFSAEHTVEGLLEAMTPNNYFVTLYVVLYLISPYLNQMLDRLSDHRFGIFAVLLLAVFSLWPTLLDLSAKLSGDVYSGLSPVNAFESQRGYTIVNFVLMYIMGAYIRRNEEKMLRLSAWIAPSALCACVLMLTAWAFAEPTSAWCYCNPLVILCACAALVTFMRWNFYVKLINWLAAGAFTCFLFHDALVLRLHVQAAVSRSVPMMLLHIGTSVGMIYIVGFLVYLLWRLITKRVFAFVYKRTEKLNLLVSVERI